MEPTHGTAGADHPPSAEAGELVLLTGRQSGTRRPLLGPITVIGRAPSCEVRLNVEGVQPLHCALVSGPDGLILRDLAGAGGTFVNDEPAINCDLHDGDTLTVGPFCFSLQLPNDGRAVVRQIHREIDQLQKEKEALRIQAAAVVAQQAALSESEARLEQRRVELKRQEEQLAAHLDEKRTRLVELQGQLRLQRETLQAERAKLEQFRTEAERELAEGRKEVTEGRQRAETQHRRLRELRKRLKARWHLHFDAERQRLDRATAELADRQRELDRSAETLRQERAAFTQSQLRHNGEQELGRRQLQAGWDELQHARRAWQETRSREEADLQRRRQDLDRRQTAVIEGEKALIEERRAWEEMRSGLDRELDGLNNRIRNHRRKILDQEQEATRLESVLRQRRAGVLPEGALPAPTVEPAPVPAVATADPPPAPATPPVLAQPEAPPEELADMELLAGEVLDQRLQLAEQCRRFQIVQQCWRADHDAAVVELERLGTQLLDREQRLDAREQTLETFAVTLRQQYDQAIEQRHHLEGWHARLASREATWPAERERLLIAVQAREEAAERQLQRLTQLQERWTEERGRESREVQIDHDRCQSFREQYVALWEECFRKNAALDQQKKTLAEKALAVEQYRLEIIGQSPNSAAAERRLEKLRNQLVAGAATTERRLAEEREKLAAEASRLNDLSRRLQHQAAELIRREEELARRLQEREHEHGVGEDTQSRLRQELQTLQGQRDSYERQVNALQQELEHLAQSLLEESETPAVFLSRAA